MNIQFRHIPLHRLLAGALVVVCLLTLHTPLSAQTMKTYKAELQLDTRSALGEGAIWDERSQTLLWVDIERGLLHRFTPNNGKNQTDTLGQKVGTVVPTTHPGDVVVALADGVYRFDLATKAKTLLQPNPEWQTLRNRFNDGKCDPQGRLWVGTIGKPSTANLYSISEQGCQPKVNQVTISNGLAWSNDGTRMYYIDTPTKEVKEYAFDGATGEIRFTRVAVKIEGKGSPDGMCIDEQGNLWVALWGGYGVACYDPESGRQIATVDVPSKQVTSCYFGGKNQKILYITTARIGISEAELGQYPHSGGLFSVETAVGGRKTNLFSIF